VTILFFNIDIAKAVYVEIEELESAQAKQQESVFSLEEQLIAHVDELHAFVEDKNQQQAHLLMNSSVFQDQLQHCVSDLQSSLQPRLQLYTQQFTQQLLERMQRQIQSDLEQSLTIYIQNAITTTRHSSVKTESAIQTDEAFDARFYKLQNSTSGGIKSMILKSWNVNI